MVVDRSVSVLPKVARRGRRLKRWLQRLDGQRRHYWRDMDKDISLVVMTTYLEQ